MAAFVGMDPAAIRRMAATLGQLADQLDRSCEAIQRLVDDAIASWEGGDAYDFHTTWGGAHRSNLQQAVAAVRRMATSAEEDADEQETASSAAGVGPGGTPFVGPVVPPGTPGGPPGPAGPAGPNGPLPPGLRPGDPLPTNLADAQALLDQARALGLPPSAYSALLNQYWTLKAADAAGIDMSRWDPTRGAEYNREIIEAVYRYYGDLYLGNPDLQWAAMANMIGPSFAAGFFDLNLFRDIAEAATSVQDPLRPVLPDGLEEIVDLPEEEFRFYETTFLDMQKQIFEDMGPQHQAYADGGMAAIRELEAAGIIEPDVADSWADIDSGDPDRVAEGNTAFLKREQYEIIRDDYDTMRDHDPTGEAMTWLMTQVGEPSIPGAAGFADFRPLHIEVETPGPERIGTPDSILGVNVPSISVDNPTQVSVDVKTPFADGNIADFDDRWDLIERDTLPAFQEYLAEHPEAARDRIAADVGDQIEKYRIYRRVDDILLQLTEWDVDVDQ